MTFATFLKINPPVFRGSTNPSVADSWFRAMERALRTQHVPADQYTEFGTYNLEGDALFW